MWGAASAPRIKLPQADPPLAVVQHRIDCFRSGGAMCSRLSRVSQRLGTSEINHVTVPYYSEYSWLRLIGLAKASCPPAAF